MHCHDVLGITENASLEEIRGAYEKKAQILASSSDTISADAYTTKQNEIDMAQNECISWCSQSNPDKLRLRMRQTKPQRKQPVRLYAVCFGPCTCTDICCGSSCCETSSSFDTSCCERETGSQTCPIVCDAILWAPIALTIAYYIIRALWTLISDAARNHASAKEERIRARISNLRSELSATVQERTALEQQLGLESERLAFLSAFATVFASMGVKDTTDITNAQEMKARELRTQILKCHDQERALQSEIRINEQRL